MAAATLLPDTPPPALVPVPPTPGTPRELTASPAWVGTAANCLLQLHLPGIAGHHMALVEREDGWWASEGKGRTLVNGRPLAGTTRLADGDVLELAPGCRWEFVSGEPREAPAEPAAAAPAAKVRYATPRGARKERKPIGLVLGIVAVVLLVAGGGYALWRAFANADREPALLTDRQAAQFDSLLAESYDHVERGYQLLELGIPQTALQEFARGVNVLATSELRDHPFVKPRIQALEASIAEIYREKRLAVPDAYARAKAGKLDLAKERAAALSAEQFATAFAEVQAAFQARHAKPIEVTGRDHAEHLQLYGKGGALDLRTKTLADVEVQFIVDEARARGIRVKDFSRDAVLQAQIKAAVAAGLADRAGTGVHLHIDRFANRADRWTVRK